MRPTFPLLFVLGGCAATSVDPVLETSDPSVLDAFVAAAAANGDVPRALARLAPRTDAIAAWYSGRLHCVAASTLRGTDAARADHELDAAIECFVRVRDEEPTFVDGAEQWIALCTGLQGTLAFASGDIDRAEERLLRAVCARPDQVNTDLGGGETIKRALLRLGAFLMRDFTRTEALFRTAALAVDDDPDLLNNAAIYARDLGTRRDRAGDHAGAVAMWERSYATYRRAVELAPHDVRLCNDCALVAIHHLRSDEAQARVMLEGAIADGEVQLRAIPEAEVGRRHDLDEAIGDCHENLALLHLHRGDAGAARAAATASLTHFPFEARAGAKVHLQAAEALLHSQ